MSAPAPRIGCVPYLNARPLLEGIGYPVTELVPARLGELFQEGMFDVALLSSVDVLTLPNPEAVEGVSISCRGPVQSVLLAYTGELADLRSIQLDPSSHTSNFLAQIVLQEFHGVHAEYVQITERRNNDLPAIVIGDPALSLSKRPSDPGLKFLDLGNEWVCSTGLPFVFALWSLKQEYTDKKYLSDLLRESKDRGLASIDRIAAETADPEFSKRYLGVSIRYDLGEVEKRGLALFAEYLTRTKLVDPCCNKIKYY